MFPTSNFLINIHSHHKPKLTNEFVIRNAFMKLNNRKIECLKYPVSVGLHPWFIDTMNINDCMNALEEMLASKNAFAVGEIGIDKASNISLNKQIEFFEAQLHVAEKFNKPIIVHAVKSYYDFIPYLKKTTTTFIFHQFNGNQQIANQLLNYSCKLSFGKNLFNTKSDNILRLIPSNSFFLETDDASHIHIYDVYNKAAEIRKVTIEELQTEIFCTFKNIFVVK